MSRLRFQVDARAEGSRARAATFHTARGEVRTPLFMPVGTQATVRGLSHPVLHEMGFPILLANTYHLLVRPGPEVFRRLGGIHRFMGWGGSVLTDSGGFQIFSLPGRRSLTEEGAEFQPHPDGRKLLLTPEASIAMQTALGSEIMMPLDHCLASTSPRELTEEAMHRTHRWAERSLVARGDSPQALFGIVQGGCFEELRRQSAGFLTRLPFDGFAIGGLAVGESRAEREAITESVTRNLPEDRPRYLMGVGTPLDLLEAVHRGVDMFDCILPTALAQNGIAYTTRGRLDLRRGVYRFSEDGLDPECRCEGCRRYSRAYLHHLIKADECLGWQSLALHNLSFYQRLMARLRAAILEGGFRTFYDEWRPRLEQGDIENPVTPPKKSPRRQPSRRLGRYEIVEAKTGRFRVRHHPSGEVMHSVNDPQEEATRLYLGQSRLVERLVDENRGPLVLWDVGLGAAVNAMAAVRAVEACRHLRPVRLVSFENDLDSLRLALRHSPFFPHLHHAAPSTLLKEGFWRSQIAPLEWQLCAGDFLDELARAPQPELIYYDPFSFKTDSALWTPEAFGQLFAQVGSKPVSLFTYSNSTSVRAALLAAGFFVARGVGIGPKTETTIAYTPRAREEAASASILDLDGSWLARWERSHRKFPPGLAAREQPAFADAIRGHAQFIGS